MLADMDPGFAFLRQYLADHDHPCPLCGYNLRGLSADCCPECGERLRLVIGAAEPKMALFLATVIALGAGAGFNVLILGWGLVSLVDRGRPDLDDMRSLMCGAVVEGGALVLLLTRRRRFRMLPVAARLLLAAGAGVATVAFACWFFAVID
jgi:hypothetical protein